MQTVTPLLFQRQLTFYKLTPALHLRIQLQSFKWVVRNAAEHPFGTRNICIYSRHFSDNEMHLISVLCEHLQHP